MPTPAPSLDHLILFLPASSSNTPIIPSTLKAAFTIIPGGTHADNLTANDLIILADGCYIELICFLPSSSPDQQTVKIQNHWWGPTAHRHGWTDWCLTTPSSPESNYEAVKRSHGQPISGARKRPDGTRVEWAVTFPQGEKGGQAQRGRVPFYCHDVTPRGLRVPIDDATTKHQCGAVGVRGITIIVGTQAGLDELKGIYVELFGGEGSVDGDEVVFEACRVENVQGLEGGARVVLRLAKGDEVEKVGEKGFWFGDVVLAAKANGGKEVGTKERIDAGGEGVGGLWVEYV